MEIKSIVNKIELYYNKIRQNIKKNYEVLHMNIKEKSREKIFLKVSVVLLAIFLIFNISACEKEEVDLSEEPLCGTWTLTTILKDGMYKSVADLIAEEKIQYTTLYYFGKDGEVICKGLFRNGQYEWKVEEGLYYMVIDEDETVQVWYSDNKIGYTYNNIGYVLEKGALSAEDLLERRGNLPVDEILITDCYKEKLEYNIISANYMIMNNTERVLTFIGISTEVDAINGHVDGQYSYYFNPVKKEIQPGEQIELRLEFNVNLNVKSIESRYYYLVDEKENIVKGEFSTPFLFSF